MEPKKYAEIEAIFMLNIKTSFKLPYQEGKNKVFASEECNYLLDTVSTDCRYLSSCHVFCFAKDDHKYWMDQRTNNNERF